MMSQFLSFNLFVLKLGIMPKLLIESNDGETLQLLKKLALKCGASVHEIQEPSTDPEKAAQILTSIAAQGNIEQIIPDPVGWQREIRANRHLPNQNQ